MSLEGAISSGEDFIKNIATNKLSKERTKASEEINCGVEISNISLVEKVSYKRGTEINYGDKNQLLTRRQTQRQENAAEHRT